VSTEEREKKQEETLSAEQEKVEQEMKHIDDMEAKM
jgi:hypothetical protein